MRPKGRIKPFLKEIEKEWIKQGTDLRFTQFLYNNGIINMDVLYNVEEDMILKIIKKNKDK